jgi:hypothetical protein
MWVRWTNDELLKPQPGCADSEPVCQAITLCSCWMDIVSDKHFPRDALQKTLALKHRHVNQLFSSFVSNRRRTR